jgi:hypothetical protein
MDKLWIPTSLAISFYGLYCIANRVGLYHLIETYVKHRAHTRPLTYLEFQESINQLKGAATARV